MGNEYVVFSGMLKGVEWSRYRGKDVYDAACGRPGNGRAQTKVQSPGLKSPERR
ncbi:hypothetical protein AB395_00001812 [Sinorhizobium fredii CCBAU 45436]|nr:hypothetical protein AB395_00001812 [Sinorhizobium fredii CCBAU 45436]AWM25321.1 hypothetical protein AOX55_00002069 [Sinorhizobium fredii CCBAU 25509]